MNVFLSSLESGEIIDIGIVFEHQVLRVASALEELDNPLLLLLVQHPLSIVVTIVVAGAVEVLSHGSTQAFLVLTLDLLEKFGESPCHLGGLPSGKQPTTLLRHLHVRIDGGSPVPFLRQLPASKKSQTLVLLGTCFHKTKLVPFRYIPIVGFDG